MKYDKDWHLKYLEDELVKAHAELAKIKAECVCHGLGELDPWIKILPCPRCSYDLAVPNEIKAWYLTMKRQITEEIKGKLFNPLHFHLHDTLQSRFVEETTTDAD